MRLFVTVAVLALLSGCASPGGVPPVPSLTPSASAVPPADLVDVEQPAQVFGGDCMAILSDAAISAALGQTLSAPDFPAEWIAQINPEERLVDQVGGIHCSWAEAPNADGSTPSPEVSIVAVPAAAVTAPEATACFPTESGEKSCPIDVTANGIRFSGLIANTVGGDPLARVAAVEALFTTGANASVGAPTVTPVNGAWATPADCSDIADSVDLTEIFGVTEPLKSDDSLGTDVFASVVEQELRGGRVLYTCTFFSGASGGIQFSVLGGGAWARDDVLAQDGATVTAAPGFDLVVQTPHGGDTIVDIFDGVNWIQSTLRDPDTTFAALGAIVDALNAA